VHSFIFDITILLYLSNILNNCCSNAKGYIMLITIARYSFPFDAHISKVRLDAEDIPSFIADEHTVNMQWMYSNAMGGVRLQVPEEFADQANIILAEDRSDELIEEQGGDFDVCHSCGSSDTEFHQIGKRWAFLMFLGLNFPLFPTKDAIKCNKCGKVTKS
jgi:hypothetical protein